MLKKYEYSPFTLGYLLCSPNNIISSIYSQESCFAVLRFEQRTLHMVSVCIFALPLSYTLSLGQIILVKT
jgi:hypothetical protein